MEKRSQFRVLKNTISLYFRTIILTIISLFTIRVVLNVLGESDYGVYNVVGGFVTLFSFVSGSLSISSQRYFALHLASDDWNGVSRLFSVNLIMYMIFIGVILFFSQTVGLWLVLNKLNYASSRTLAAIIVYETSIITFLIGVLVSPFLALLLADENLSIYSLISIIEGVLKILVAYLLRISSGDKLIIYAFLVMMASCSVNSFYFIYIKKKYKRLKLVLCKDKTEYKMVFSYLNWNLIGSIASVCKSQGVNIIINIFFGSSINAARGVATQINNAIVSFSQNFMKAVDPLITKAYANKNKDKFLNLINIASKLSFSLLFVVAIPVIFNSNYILTLWLENVPQYTVLFTNLVLIDALVASLTDPILTGVQATGKVKLYQIVIGGLNLLNLPVSYIFLKVMQNPYIPFVVAIVISFAMGFGRMIIFKKVYSFELLSYITNVVLPMSIMSGFSVLFMSLLFENSTNFAELILKVVGSILVNVFLVFVIGLNKNEKNMLLILLREKFGSQLNNLG